MQNATHTQDFLTLSLPPQPLFLRTVAPDSDDGAVAVYRMTLLCVPEVYAVHWLTRPDGAAGGRGRRRCAGEGCPWCAQGHTPQEMYAGLVIDHDNDRLAIAQMSKAAATSVAKAMTDYVLAAQGRSSTPVRAVGLADPRQPVITLRAVRSERGPRYSAKAALREFTRDPNTGRRLGLAAWFDTDEGADWLQDALVKSAPVLYPYALRPEALDPLRFIWPDEHAAHTATEDDDD